MHVGEVNPPIGVQDGGGCIQLDLDEAGEQVILSAPGRVADAVRFKGQEYGVSYGRYPDGSPNWITTLLTVGSSNQPVAQTIRFRH